MTRFRTFTILAALTAAPLAYADKPAEPKPPVAKAPDKTTEKTTHKATDKAPDQTADKPVDKKPLSEADAQRFYAFFDKLVGIVVTNKADCGKMATGVNAHIDANQALLKEAADAKASGRELPQSVRDKIAKKTADELAPAMKQKCMNDKPVMDAFMRMKPPSAK
jgi:hypothetical protein